MGTSTEELNQDIAGTRESLAADLDALQDRVSPAAIVERRKAAARGRVASVKGRLMGTAQSARSSAGSSASGASDNVRGTAESVKGSAQDAMGAAEEQFEGSPLAAGLVAFGAGMLLSALLPASDKEAQAAQRLVKQAQPLVDEAKSVGAEVGEQLKGVAADAAQEVKDTAQESAQRVQEEGASSADSVKSDVQGS
ncbi:DUF3618 domain-containing protein [Nocardioides pacificus]